MLPQLRTSEKRRAPDHLTLDEVVEHWAHTKPNSEALRFISYHQEGLGVDEDTITWFQFQEKINQFSDYLAQFIRAQEPVCVVCADTVTFHILIVSLWRINAIVALIDRSWGRAITRDIVSCLDCSLILIPENYDDNFLDCTQLKVQSHEQIKERSRSCGHPALIKSIKSLDAIALYATTSGTSDNPKCIPVTHRQIRSAYKNCLNVHNFDDLCLCACLFKVNSLGILGVCFLLQREIGSATYVYPSFTMYNLSRTWNHLRKNKYCFVYLVPSLVRLINTLPRNETHAEKLLAFCSGAPVTKAELCLLEERQNLIVFNCYGLTELSFAVFFGSRSKSGTASDSIGKPLGIQARLLSPEGHEIVGPGIGELQITGPMLTSGYHKNPIATEKSRDGIWLKTGDIAERDTDGFYFIRGRVKDIVLRGGITHYLYEIEHYLRSTAGVVDAFAFSGRTLPSGDELCILLQTEVPINEDDIRRWIHLNLGKSKSPSHLYMTTNLIPRNSNGKINAPLIKAKHFDGSLQAYLESC